MTSNWDRVNATASTIAAIAGVVIAVIVYCHTYGQDATKLHEDYRREFRETMKKMIDGSRQYLERESVVYCSMCSGGESATLPGCGPLGAIKLETDKVIQQEFEINTLYAFQLREKIRTDVTANESLAIARALFQCNRYPDSRVCVEEALAKTVPIPIQTRVDAQLLHARCNYAEKKYADGYKQFDICLKQRKDEKNDPRIPDEQSLCKVDIMLTWAATEVYHKEHEKRRNELETLVETAGKAAADIPETPRQRRMREIAAQLWDTVSTKADKKTKKPDWYAKWMIKSAGDEEHKDKAAEANPAAAEQSPAQSPVPIPMKKVPDEDPIFKQREGNDPATPGPGASLDRRHCCGV